MARGKYGADHLRWESEITDETYPLKWEVNEEIIGNERFICGSFRGAIKVKRKEVELVQKVRANIKIFSLIERLSEEEKVKVLEYLEKKLDNQK